MKPKIRQRIWKRWRTFSNSSIYYIFICICICTHVKIINALIRKSRFFNIYVFSLFLLASSNKEMVRVYDICCSQWTAIEAPFCTFIFRLKLITILIYFNKADCWCTISLASSVHTGLCCLSRVMCKTVCYYFCCFLQTFLYRSLESYKKVQIIIFILIFTRWTLIIFL